MFTSSSLSLLLGDFMGIGDFHVTTTGLVVLILILLAPEVWAWLALRYISNDYVGIVEKLWSASGSVPEGQIIALNGEAGYQAALLRGGIHLGLWRWQYAVHKVRLVNISEGKIGYVYARDGQPLPSSQTLGRVVECNNFQDAGAFLNGEQPGQRGRQRAVLREGVYAINLALFTVITESKVHVLEDVVDRSELERDQSVARCAAGDQRLQSDRHWSQNARRRSHGVEQPRGSGQHRHCHGARWAVAVAGRIIAPAVGAGRRRSALPQQLSGCRGVPRRWWAARPAVCTAHGRHVLHQPLVRIGRADPEDGRADRLCRCRGELLRPQGQDVTGTGFRHGERVGEGERGVRQRPLGPGKYAFNTSAGSIVLVPTTNFVLHWITGKTESHRYDESLKSIDLVTKDAYEPLLPLSVVVHIDYERAPGVIQRFGDVKKLITQTLDPMLSAFFRDIAHTKTMLELLHERKAIQEEAREKLRSRFREFDIECVDVLIGKPDPREGDEKIETLLEQLRQRQLSTEQVETYDRQRIAAEKRRVLLEAEAQAEMQTKLTNARVNVQVAESHGEAELAVARKKAEQTIVVADAELARSRREAEQTVVLAEAMRTARSAGRPRRVAEDRASRFGRGVGAAAADCFVRRPAVVRVVASVGESVEQRPAAGAGASVCGRRFGRRQRQRFDNALDEWFARCVDQPASSRKIGLPIRHRQPRAEGLAVARGKARGRGVPKRQAAGESDGEREIIAE